MQFEQAYSFLMQKLAQELSPEFTYHNTKHTKAVIQATQQLALTENIDNYNTEILNAAALFHDAGFLLGYKDHEEASCRIAKEYLPRFDYTETEINQICRLIIATRLPQAPGNIMESIICDADLHYLVTDRYFAVSENLFHEYIKLSLLKNRAEWRKN